MSEGHPFVEPTLFVDAGRVLALLPRPMNQEEVRAFAVRAVNDSATLPARSPTKLKALCAMIQPELTARGALLHQIQLVARATMHAEENAMALDEGRSILGSVWAGVLITEHRAPGT